MTKIHFEGDGEIGITKIICICGFCGNHESEKGAIEFNFREQKVFFLCSNPECKKMNEIYFSRENSQPLPRSRIG